MDGLLDKWANSGRILRERTKWWMEIKAMWHSINHYVVSKKP